MLFYNIKQETKTGTSSTISTLKSIPTTSTVTQNTNNTVIVAVLVIVLIGAALYANITGWSAGANQFMTILASLFTGGGIAAFVAEKNAVGK
jgi:hypothetical protein